MAKTRRASRKERKSRKAERKASRKTQRGGKKASKWTDAVTSLYKKMRKENSNVKFGDALKKASELKKKGQLY